MKVPPLADDIRAYANELLESPDVDDRNIAAHLEAILDRHVPVLVPLRTNMGAAHHRPGHGTEAVAGELALPRAGTIREGVVTRLWAYRDGYNQEEMALSLGKRLYSVAPRFAELQRMGWIKNSGRTRPTTTGTPAIVWVLTDAGRQKWANR